MTDRYWDSDKSEWVWPDFALQDQVAAMLMTAMKACGYQGEDPYITPIADDLTMVVIDSTFDIEKLAGVVIESFENLGWKKS